MVLGSQPEAEPVLGDGDREKLSASVERDICGATSICTAIFLPPAGLYQRILREVEAPLIEHRTWMQPAEIRRNVPICWGSTGIRCAKRSPISIFR